MNRNFLVVGVALLVATVLGFTLNAPILGWIFLIAAGLVLIGAFVGANPTTSDTTTSSAATPGDPTDLSVGESVIGLQARPLGTMAPSNPGAPVNAGPPHISESREDPFDNNGSLGDR